MYLRRLHRHPYYRIELVIGWRSIPLTGFWFNRFKKFGFLGKEQL